MKAILPLLLLSAVCAHAGFESWTNKDGRSADLELVKVVPSGDEKAGQFRTRFGKSVTLKASELSPESAFRLNAWKPAEETVAAATSSSASTGTAAASAFDSILDGNLEKLEGKSVKRYTAEKPEKFYIFYYSASWCGPCHQYTPSLVSFYEKVKPGNKNFEIVLITSDSEESAMEGYIKEKKMPWPVLKMAKAEKFKKEFKHGVTGIPSVVVCKLDGTVVAKTTDTAQLEKIVTEK